MKEQRVAHTKKEPLLPQETLFLKKIQEALAKGQ